MTGTPTAGTGRALLESAAGDLLTLQAAMDLNDGAKKVVAAVG